MIKIAPSVLAADFTKIEKQIKEVESAGADWIHVDVMDGHYVPNITFGPVIVKAIRKLTKLPLDVHLMVEEPDHLIPSFIEAGANYITVHVEAIKHIHRTIQLIKEHKAKAGVSLNPGTSHHSLGTVIHDIDLVLVMTVNPGYGGQAFIHTSLEKIKLIRNMIDSHKLKVDLEVDGGIDSKTAPLTVQAGANVLVAGTSIFRQDDISIALNDIRNSVI